MAQLCEHEAELKRLNVEVLLISFANPVSARAWLRETCAPFRLLLDPQRAVYRAYGLERSWLRSWNLRTLRRYVELMRAGRTGEGSKATRLNWAATSSSTCTAQYDWHRGGVRFSRYRESE